MRKSPCYGCEERKIGCHSSCEIYLDFYEAHEADKETIRKAKEKYRSPRFIMTDREFANANRSQSKNKVFKQHKR